MTLKHVKQKFSQFHQTKISFITLTTILILFFFFFFENSYKLLNIIKIKGKYCYTPLIHPQVMDIHIYMSIFLDMYSHFK